MRDPLRRLFSRSRVSAEQRKDLGHKEEVEDGECGKEVAEEDELRVIVDFDLTALARICLPNPITMAGVTQKRIRNEKAKRYLNSMRKKSPVTLSQKFSNADPSALRVLEPLLAFDPKDGPTAEEALSDPYFHGLANLERESSTQPISKLEGKGFCQLKTKKLIKKMLLKS